MLVKYYKDRNIKYSTKKRYKTLSIEPFNSEENNSVILGDGAETVIKTSSNNICDYVTINDTKWFVTSYTYENGGQVTLFLQRDVIGEFGLDNMVGKVERGFTDSVLKNRKELDVNEILKDRKKLIPSTYTYGNYTVDNHENEMWGVLYFAKPTELDPNTGQPYPDTLYVPIPAFSPQYVNYDPILEGSRKLNSRKQTVERTIIINVTLRLPNNNTYNGAVYCTIIGNPSFTNDGMLSDFYYSYDIKDFSYSPPIAGVGRLYLVTEVLSGYYDYTNQEIVRYLAESLIKEIIQDESKVGITLPFATYDNITNDYSNLVVKENNLFFEYTGVEESRTIRGNGSDDELFRYFNSLGDREITLSGRYGGLVRIEETEVSYVGSVTSSYYDTYILYSKRQLSLTESGTIAISTIEQLVDEPYSILVFPLYNVKITGDENFDVVRSEAFMIFNTVIQYMSGENGYLIDAQIYPYCPVLTSVATSLLNYPFFSIPSNSYSHECYVSLMPFSDVKKEYIARKYSLVSPEQSGQIDFNYYDYETDIIDLDGKNTATMQVTVKTALKPFSIISCAVIVPDGNSIKGITYGSDLRGSNSTANGFECSLSSNAFETYKRQNSNYQQIFALQKQELEKQHATERVNEKTAAVVNSLSASAMGAIGGGALGGGGKAGAIAAAIGGVAAGATVGIANAIQYNQNEKLREFEVSQQQQNFDFAIGTIKALPNSINRVSSFNEIILRDFWYIIEIYECSDYELELIDTFIERYGYGIGVFGIVSNFYRNGWFLRANLITSELNVNLHNIADKELKGGIYYYE